ncbi:MAG: aromatic ring-hydroxylating dioxygenase subunit alpha, partial [Rhodobacteraceae bacterium]|nr:aromatic ring-hydroxylating dioxygenase subunit alpha [Paracoccaceae bacterium]
IMIPYLIESPCNWLQVMENAWDPYHVVYLHTKAVRTQFIEAFAEMPKIQFHERDYGDFYTNTRRVEDIIWIRVHDLFLPSFTQNGGHFPIPDKSRYFGRCGLSRWVTPIDDTRTMVIAWRHFREGDDPRGLTDPNEVGLGKTDFYGQSGDRDYETRQKDPGDYDAWVSQGSINIHQRENLAFTDRGVAKVRRKLRSALNDLFDGKDIQRPSDVYENPIPTYGGDTMLNIPLQDGRDDAAIQKIVALKVAEIYQSGDRYTGRQRTDFIVKELREYEQSWANENSN